MRLRLIVLVAASLTACIPYRTPVSFDMKRAALSTRTSDASEPSDESYAPVTHEAALILGCDAAPASPVCEIGLPTAEEDSAFRAESDRLASHPDARCRKLGVTIAANEPEVRMYRTALVRSTGSERLYGVGHAYEVNDVWSVRIARRIDALNDRTLDEKKRTLRHETSHTIGATETAGSGWTAEDYATNCG
jgi:hypothetical protein